MKKLFALCMSVIMAFTLSACADKAAQEESLVLADQIDVYVPASSGGATDVTIRAFSDYINANNDCTVTVTNNSAGSGIVAMETVRNSMYSDGSDILFFHSSMISKTATGYYDYDIAENFRIIGVAAPTNPNRYALVVPSSWGIKNLDEFKEAVNAGTNKIGVEAGGSSHIIAGLMEKAMGIDLRFIDAGPDMDKISALMLGNIDCALVNVNSAKEYSENGLFKVLAIVSVADDGERSEVLPEVPSFIEEGYNITLGFYMYILGPASMTDETARAIYELFREANENPAVEEKLKGNGLGLTFFDYEDNLELTKAQQAYYDQICDELGLKKSQ